MSDVLSASAAQAPSRFSTAFTPRTIFLFRRTTRCPLCKVSMLRWISRRAGYRANHAGCDTIPGGIPRFGHAALKSQWASMHHRRTWYRSSLAISQWILSHSYSRKYVLSISQWVLSHSYSRKYVLSISQWILPHSYSRKYVRQLNSAPVSFSDPAYP